MVRVGLPIAVKDVGVSKNHALCCGAAGGCFWKEEKKGRRINQKCCDRLRPRRKRWQSGHSFCVMLEYVVKSRSLEKKGASGMLQSLLRMQLVTPVSER
jgi:hypothetical protein